MICELALVIAIDVSGSVSDRYYELQRDATARAIELVVNPNQNLPIALSVVMWGQGPVVVLPWQILHTRQHSGAVARQLSAVQRPMTGLTNMVAAIEKSIEMLDDAPCNAERQLIDISGDGTSDDGDPSALRDRAQEMGIQINGLPIVTDVQTTDIVQYFRDKVITYDGFIVAANDWNDYARAIRGKLSLEIAGTLE